MKLPFAGFWRGLIEELRFESSNIDQVDTIWRWLGLMVFFYRRLSQHLPL